ncbi:MAG: MmgE/PrpD family protein, partial [Bacillota bacterium]
HLATGFGICGSLAAGSYEFKSSGAWTKRLHAAHASRSGVLAAHLAAEGFSGPHTVLEGKAGFYHCYAGEGNYQIEHVLRDLGADWELDYIQYKPYACAGVLHAALTATQDLLRGRRIEPCQVDKAIVEASSTVLEGYAQANHYHPLSPVDAQFSLPYAVAAMIRWGRALPAEFSERALHDEEVRSLVARVEPRAAGDIDQAWPGRDRARVELRLRDGTVLRGEADCPKGELGRPMSEDEVIEKYRELSSYVLSPEQVSRLEDTCLGIETLTDISQLLDCAVVPGARCGR